MNSELAHKLWSERWLFIYFALVSLSILLAVLLEKPAPLAIPLAILFGVVALTRPSWLYFALAVAMPVSTELLLPGNLGTDFPSEQLMWALFSLAGFFFIAGMHRMDLSKGYHPAVFLLLMSYFWIWVTAAFASSPLPAIKYALAKSWYLAVFFILALYFFRDRIRLDLWFRVLIATVTVTVIIVLVRHAVSGFSFDQVNKVLNPFYRNHVMYACMTGLSVPWAWYLMKRRQIIRGGMFNIWTAVLGLLLIATFLSYTRAAMVALLAVAVWPLIIRWRLTKWICTLSVIGGLLVAAYFLRQNHYLEYAPDYYRTITHKKFDRLLEATYQLEDISTMERAYRWIAGYYMMRERPVTGFGPANFYPQYKSYTVTSFQTYVSDNPERSGIHNYYFMLIVEQGWPGLIFFLLFAFYVLHLAQRLYHLSNLSDERILYLSCAMCMVFVLVISLMNDMIETDKVGSVFFISSAILIAAAIRKKVY